MNNSKDYALSLLNKEKMKLVKSISCFKNEVICREKWIENFKIEVIKLQDEEQNKEWVKRSLEVGIKSLDECKNILKEKRNQLISINNAIAILKNRKN